MRATHDTNSHLAPGLARIEIREQEKMKRECVTVVW